jgi:hypothetical protein
MVALLPSLSDKDLRMLTPTLEELGLMAEPEIRARWEKSLETATDQRALNVAKNVQSAEIREKLEEAAGHAVRQAVESADVDVRVMFLIDRSGSMQGAIEKSKDALTKIDEISFQVYDAGICLSGADREVNLESLPSVIREAIDSEVLVVTRR